MAPRHGTGRGGGCRHQTKAGREPEQSLWVGNLPHSDCCRHQTKAGREPEQSLWGRFPTCPLNRTRQVGNLPHMANRMHYTAEIVNVAVALYEPVLYTGSLVR